MAADASIQTEFAHIVCTPGVLGGEPRIDGHRIRVRDIVAARDQGGYSPEEISASIYPGLSLAEVYAALAYFEDHRAEIEKAIANDEQVADEFRQRHPDLVGPKIPKQYKR
jgi:uncharacterized protein (DUF433 family)